MANLFDIAASAAVAWPGAQASGAPFREAYLPLDQGPPFNYALVVRTSISPNSVAEDLKKADWSLDRDESIVPLRTMVDIVNLGLVQTKFRGCILGGFAGVALVLSAARFIGF